MTTHIGEKIRTLRKQKNISQEVLARYLGVSFQAVSKWETGSTMPDLLLIPAIASIFEVSCDELLDFNRLDTERKVQQSCWDIAQYRYSDPLKAENDLRELLKQYPGNETILNNLIYSLQINGKYPEVVDTCKALIESAKEDDTRYDAARILAETYKAMGEYALCKETINLIPEFFFSHREEKALLLEGEDMFRPAWQQKCQSLETAVTMNMRIADYYMENGDPEKARHQLTQAEQIIVLLKDDLVPPFWKDTIYDYPLKDLLDTIHKRLESM